MAWFAKGRIKGYVWISGWIFKIQFLLSFCRQCTPLSKYNGNLCLECILQRWFPSKTRFFTAVKGNIIFNPKQIPRLYPPQIYIPDKWKSTSNSFHSNHLSHPIIIISWITSTTLNARHTVSTSSIFTKEWNIFNHSSIVTEFHRNLQFFVITLPFLIA